MFFSSKVTERIKKAFAECRMKIIGDISMGKLFSSLGDLPKLEQEGRIGVLNSWTELPNMPKPKAGQDTIRRKAYICCAISGDVEHNLDNAKTYCRLAYNFDYIPICPALMFLQFMDEINEREEGISMAMELLKDCSVLLVFGNVITVGMQKEIDWWQENKQYHSIQYL